MLFSCSDKQVVAIAGGEKITLENFNERCQNKAKLLGQDSLTPDQKKEVLDSMIQREIVSLHARQKGETISDDELDEATRSLSLLSKRRHRGEIEKNLLFRKMKEKIEGNIAVSKEDIESYYSSHKQEFVKPILYKIYLVKVEKEDLDHVLKKLKDRPEAFDDMALKRVSPDLAALNKNARLTPKKGFPEEMGPFLKNMKIGDIAGPVEVERGTFLFKLIDRQSSAVRPLKEVYQNIHDRLTLEKREEAFTEWYEKVLKDYPVKIVDMAFAGTGEKGE